MMEIFNHEQGTPEWLQCRIGIPTASEFSTVLAKGKDGGPSLTRAAYMRRIAAEIITGEPLESFKSAAMERGNLMEGDARNYYSMLRDEEPQQVGFIRNGAKGCSPDSLIGENGMLEIKTQRGDLLIETLSKGTFPAEHVAQCQGALWVAERDWIDICVYWPKMPVFIQRAYRDEVYISRLCAAVDAFNTELGSLVNRIRAYGRMAA